MASMREIKRRRESVQNIQQITKAMKLVSTIKVQKARTRAQEARAYFASMNKAVTGAFSRADAFNQPCVFGNNSEKIGIIVLASDRGLAGGYNANILKKVQAAGIPKEKIRLYMVGKKGAEAFGARGYEVARDYSGDGQDVTMTDVKTIAESALADFLKEYIGELYIVYTEFKNMISYTPTMLKILPVPLWDAGMQKNGPMNFEPDANEVLTLLIPRYVTAVLYGAFAEAQASEYASRMQAMDLATNNAQELIDDLNTTYNRVRQSTITQEITEIIAGAKAIG